MSRARRMQILAALFSATLVVAVAGCSSSHKSAATSSVAGASGASAATGTPINIGVIQPENTAIYNVPDEVAAVAAAIRAVNAAGGVSGHKLVLDYCNSQNDPSATAACGRKMASDHVVIVANSIDILGPALAQQLSAEQIPDAGNEPLYPGEFDGPYLFPMGEENQLELPVEVAEMAKLGLTKLITVLSPSIVPAFSPSINLAAQKAGVTVVGNVPLPNSGVSDYAPFAQQIISSGANVVLTPLAAGAEIPLVQALRQAGSKITVANVPNLSPAQLQQYQSDFNGTIYVSSAPPLTAATEKIFPALAQMATEMAAQEKTGDTGANLNTAIAFSPVRVWLVMHAIANIMATIKGPITASSMTQALNSAKNVDMLGIMSPWTPSSTLDVPGLGATKLAETSFFVSKVENGALVLLDDKPVDARPYL